jgi:hypothetical protein
MGYPTALNLTIAHKYCLIHDFCTINEFDFVIQKMNLHLIPSLNLRILFKYYKLTFFWSCRLLSILSNIIFFQKNIKSQFCDIENFGN